MAYAHCFEESSKTTRVDLKPKAVLVQLNEKDVDRQTHFSSNLHFQSQMEQVNDVKDNDCDMSFIFNMFLRVLNKVIVLSLTFHCSMSVFRQVTLNLSLAANLILL
ncbi:hypothetical protein Ddc_14557 [Ditylenchus destructor]|nr:hypothetical protein Ddc_14557 [Ditylenchus destructor]